MRYARIMAKLFGVIIRLHAMVENLFNGSLIGK